MLAKDQLPAFVLADLFSNSLVYTGENLKPEPISETLLPAAPYNAEVYTRNPLPVGFYRLRDE